MKSLLSSSAFLIVNKRLSQAVGLKASVLLADLISKEEYFIEKGSLQDGYFFNTEENIQRDTTLTPYQQRNALKTLKNHNILEVKRMGVPAKLHFKINDDTVMKFLNNKSLKKPNTINKKKYNKKNISIREKEFSEEVFQYGEYETEMCQDFVDYWTESDKRGVMKFEKEKTWSVSRRLSRWKKMSNKFNKITLDKPKGIKSQVDIMEQVLNKIK